MIRKLTPLFALLLLLGAAGPLAAAGLRFELGFGWTLVAPRLNATYFSQYAPPFVPQNLYVASSATQTVHFKGKTSYGFNGFFNLFFSENIGLQVLADYHRPGIGGENGPYEGQVQFLDYNGEVRTEELSSPWPNSAGNLAETTFSFNALARFPLADKLDLSVSAGPTIFNFEGKAGYIGYTVLAVVLGDLEYTLTGMHYQTVVALDPQTKYGFNLGVEAAYEFMRHVILALDLRWYQGPAADVQMHIVDDDIYPVPVEQIEQTIGLGRLTIDPSYMRVGLAIRFIF
jgi:hypothetical protein